ncbi:MAG: TIGR02679 family protein, partial [Planctomycetota bacterium]
FGMEVPKSARDRREILELAGIYVDELSSTVLSLNLPAGGVGVADRTLQCHADAGMPCRLTVRHLRHDPPVLDDADQVLLRSGPRRLFVCENPSVLAAAADALGPRCPPLLCLEGNPSVACMRLLDLLCSAGFKIWYHGDFDWGGIRIANRIYERFGFRPWRFQAGDYEPHRSQGRALKGSPVDAGWDSGLRAVVEQGGQAVDEETDIESLLKDLREASAGKRQ